MKTRRQRLREAALDLLALLLGLLVMFPVIYGICGAFKTPQEFAAWPPRILPQSFANLENFARVFAMAPMARYFLNSLIVAGLSSAVRLIVAVLAAYAFAFFHFPGRKFFFFFMLGTMMLPADTLILTNYRTISSLGLIDTYLGMSIVSFVGASQMFMLRQHFRTSPTALREAAMLDGCGDLRFVAAILVPTAKPICVTLFLQSFLTQWHSYLWPLLVTNRMQMRTVQVGLTMLTTVDATNYEVMMAGATIVVVPTMLFYLLMRRVVTRAMSEGPLLA